MRYKFRHTIWLRTAILLAVFALALTSLRGKSPTFDEQGFLVRGVAYLRGENKHLRVGHPLGLNALNGLFLSLDEQVILPVDDPSWEGSSFHRPSELFLWEIGNDVERIMFLGRLPTIWLGMLLVAIAGRWAWELVSKELAALLAMLLLAVDPNILAHSRLATTDLGLATAALLAGFMLWRFWKRPSWQRAALAGGAFGLLLNTKFTAGLFIPLLTIVMLIAFLDRWRLVRSKVQPGSFAWRPLAMLIVCYPLAGFLVLWASYGFQVGTLPGNLPIMSQLGGTTWPLSHYLEQLLDIGGRMQKSTPSFLWGQYSDNGWWYYFPVAFLTKTPLQTLILITWAGVRIVMCVFHRLGARSCLTILDVAALLIPAAGYFAFALTTDINLGYRHLLPVLPFLAVFVGAMLSNVKIGHLQPQRKVNPARLALALLVLLLGLAALRVYPHFLTYFNVLVGGPDGGWRIFVDSNLDWGQDLAGLKSWMAENDVESVKLSYFGEARPEYYGINYQGLDSFPPRLMNPKANPYFPFDPAPGIYAISATNLQGVHFQDHAQFAWFREREPADKIGNSIFIYQVSAKGEPVDLVLSGLQLFEFHPEDFASWASNDVTTSWFDGSQSLILPAAERSWLALASDQLIHPRIAQEIESWELERENADYRLYRQPADARANWPELASFENGLGRISLIDALSERQHVAAGDVLEIETRWRRQGDAEPLKIFIHVTNASGDIIAQWDGLGVLWEGWTDQDELLQLHQIQLPERLASGTYTVWAGIYNPGSGIRWQTAVGDRFLVDEITVDH